jgi:hypothetical protein
MYVVCGFGGRPPSFQFISLANQEPILRPLVAMPALQKFSMARFRLKFIFRRCKNALAYYNTCVVNSKAIGLSPNESFLEKMAIHVKDKFCQISERLRKCPSPNRGQCYM